MRCYLVKICKAKPIGIKNRVFHYLKIDRVSTPIVCFEKENLPFVPNFIRRENIDKSNLKLVHKLHAFQIVNMLSFSFHTLLFLIHGTNFFFSGCNASFCTIKPCSNLFWSSMLKSSPFCFHNDNCFVDSRCKIKNYI